MMRSWGYSGGSPKGFRRCRALFPLPLVRSRTRLLPRPLSPRHLDPGASTIPPDDPLYDPTTDPTPG